MGLYRVLLVDDEEDIRVGISRKIDWAGLGFSLVGEAENGAEALEIAEQLRPDVVLTDIKMPFMDGLELCRRLTQQLPAAKMVVFSGFDEFEYARQAVGLNVSEYILKPIGAAELTAVLEKLRREIQAERAERKDVEILRRLYEESLPVLRELFYTRLLDGQIRGRQVVERAARYEIDLSGKSWIAAIVHVDGPVAELSGSRDELILLSVQSFFNDHFSLENCTVRQVLYRDNLALIFSFQGEAPVYALLEELGRVCDLAKSYLGLNLTAGVGSSCEKAEDLYQSAEGARSALDYRVLVDSRVIYIGDLEPGRSATLTFDEESERALSAAVKLGSEEDVLRVVDGLMAQVRAAGLDLPQCHYFFLELVTCFLKLARAGGVEAEEVFGANFAGGVQVTDFASLEELSAWCRERSLRLRELLGRRRTASAGRTVEKAREFIAEHYADPDLSVEMLCEHLHLSQAYFSTLFKRETGMGFTAYVTQVRMDAAAALLRETDEKTYLIAQKTGYSDPNYFSYVFKRQFGRSPSKFRSER